METLTRYYETERSLLRLQRQLERLKEEITQAKYDLRKADQALTEYGSSLRFLLDRFSGRQEETREALQRQLREAEAKHSSLLRQRERLTAELEQAQKERSFLPPAEELRRQAEPKQWAALETALCAEALLPLLEENYEALLEYRRVLRGEYPILSSEDRQEKCAQPNVRAQQCLPWLNRLKEAQSLLGNPFDPGSYYASPAAYLVAAAQHNQLDRANNALTQVEKLQKLVKGML